METFLKRIEKTLAQNTADVHNNSFNILLKLFKNRFLDQITRSMIEDFKAVRARDLKKGSKTQLVSPATVNRELGTLKNILNMAVDDELITISPARKVQPSRSESCLSMVEQVARNVKRAGRAVINRCAGWRRDCWKQRENSAE